VSQAWLLQPGVGVVVGAAVVVWVGAAVAVAVVVLGQPPGPSLAQRWAPLLITAATVMTPATVTTPATVMTPATVIRLTPPMATTDLAITDMPLGRIRAIAIIMRQHGPRIMRIGRAGKEVEAAVS
jgi:hypothetical protein